MSRFCFLLSCIFLLNSVSFGQYDTIIHSNKATVAILKLNYFNHQFEGGAMRYFDCAGCTTDSIPFNVMYESPSDFGSICLRMTPTLDTLFFGQIFWAGSGWINVPETFSNGLLYSNGPETLSPPNSIQYLDYFGDPMQSQTMINDAYQCWNSISNMEITQVFANSGFRVAIFLYTPEVGGVDWSIAKWIVFLYHPNSMLNLNEADFSRYTISPNPFTNSISFPSDKKTFEFKLFSSSGALVKSGIALNGEINELENLQPGIYFLESKQNEVVRFDKVMKN